MRPAGHAVRRAPRRWSGTPSARTSATDAPWATAPATRGDVATVVRMARAATAASSSTSHNFHRDRTTNSPTPGAAGEDHPTSSGEKERTTSVDHDIGEIRLTSSPQIA